MKEKETALSAFDLDDTLIEGNASARFCRYLYRKNVLSFTLLIQSFIYSIRHRFFGMSLRELHHSVFNKVLRGKPLEFLEKYIDTFVHETIKKGLYEPALKRLRKAQAQGHYTMILSNSPNFLVKRFAKALGVNTYRATEYIVDKEKRFTKIKRILEGKDKAKHIENMAKKLGVFLEQVTIYSDSFLDLEFLQMAGTPIAVNPDKKLREISLKNKWRII